MNKIDKLKQILMQEDLTCIISQHGVLHKADTNGIRPILKFLDQAYLQDAIVVDKVIGKAAAMVLAHGGVQHIHALILSKPALSFLNTHHISVSYEQEVDYIINRTHDGMCPMESCVLDCDDISEGVDRLKEKVQQLASHS